ncbi:MAG: HD-GYP domain-containing protein [Peptostreptococcaceae bacterium]|jgi:HD-GYP domain-containing protein (c-di-GMP phosphodiesterase class II)|nr:HD-GYP domain-containing protein [Peptostreptococcaceae bacterium]
MGVVHSGKVVTIKASQLMPGMVLAKDLKYGEGVIKANTKLSKLLADRLRDYSSTEVSVYHTDTNDKIIKKKIQTKINKIDLDTLDASKELKELQETDGEDSNILISPNSKAKKIDMPISDHFAFITDKIRVNMDVLQEGTVKTTNFLTYMTDYIILNITDFKKAIEIIAVESEEENYLYNHITHVAILNYIQGKWHTMESKDLRLLIKTGLLFDIGLVKIKEEILNKPGKLTDKEYAIVKKHPTLTYELIKRIPFLSKSIKYGVLMHHEREDGTGYPLGLTGDKIHPFGKITALSDIFDAITSNRPYKTRDSLFKVLDVFQKESYGLLDPKYSMIFIKKIINYYINSTVLLSNGETGNIIKMNVNNISRPLVKCNDMFYDLDLNREIKIERIKL